MTDADLLIRAGTLLWGPAFKGQMAHALDADIRDVRRWCAGTRPIPDWAIAEMPKLLSDRRGLLNNLILAFGVERERKQG